HFRVVGTDRSISLPAVAQALHRPVLPANFELGLEGSGSWPGDTHSFPNGCHICEVEVDPNTGAVSIARYTVIDDVGAVINPLICQGQVHGGLAQGIGQALMEKVVYDRGSGQLLSGSFMDYSMPRADDFPA